MNSIKYFRAPAKILISLLAIGVLFNCTSPKESRINYPGQKSPGMVAELFAPGIVSTNLYEHSAPAFAPDGSVVLWGIMDTTYRGYLLEMKYENGSWSPPARPSFADPTADDYYPSFSADGKKLYFSSRRKAPSSYSRDIDMRIWEVERTATGWGHPLPFDTVASPGHEYAHSITKNGTLYFSSPHGGGTSMNIHKAEKENGHYTKPVFLPYSINSVDYEDGPYIAPDESFLIFESQRPEGTGAYSALYISFKHEDGLWGMPVNMGPKINSGKGERFARLSPDGKYLFFGSYRNMSADNRGADIYWIDAKVIDELKNDEKAKTIIQQPLGDEIMDALYKNNVKGATGLLKKWLGLYPNTLDATVIYSSMLRKQHQYSEAEQLLIDNATRWNENTGFTLEQALVKFGVSKDEEAARLLTPILKEGNQLRDRFLYLSNSLFDMKKFKPSDEYFEKAMSISPGNVDYYNRACSYTHIGYNDKAFADLNKAADLGYNTKKNYEGDPDLEPLKSDPRWKALMEKLK